MRCNFRGFVRAVGPVALIALTPWSSFAWFGTGGCIYDGHTRYMWSRTWHAPNALATPLNQYYIPRVPGNCGSGMRAGEMGCQGSIAMAPAGQYGGQPYPANAAYGFEPVQFERLGRVPNELDVIGSLGAPPASAASGPRR